MMSNKQALPASCHEVPEFERLNYFYGQMLSVADFRTEQDYFREKRKLHNRCHHGWGVVCGLHVTPVPTEEPCLPDDHCDWQELCAELDAVAAEIEATETLIDSGELSDEDLELAHQKLAELRERHETLRRRKECMPPSKQYPDDAGKVRVDCGVALDCCGNDIVVRQAVVIDIEKSLAAESLQHCNEQDEPVDVYLSVCFCDQPTHPSRPVVTDTCGALYECNYGRYRESIRFQVGLEPPATDERCGGCCEPCADPCVVLARIRWQAGKPITADDIDCGVRRPIGVYQPTVISGISWQHGASYGSGHAKKVLGTESQGPRTDGLEIRFSRPVYTDTLKPGVIDVWRVQGGSGLRGVISNMEGSYVGLDGDKTESVFFRDDTGETLNSEDRVLITVRCNFILDCCCRPVDGYHVGGRVPQLPDYAAEDPNGERPTPEVCPLPPSGCGPWTSGNGQPGGNFESWFYVI